MNIDKTSAAYYYLQDTNKYIEDSVSKIESLTYKYPLYFNRNNGCLVQLNNNISLSQNGDSLEVDVTPGVAELLQGGYAFSCGAVHSSKVALAITHKNVAVRADDGTWITSINELPVFKKRFTFKIEYADSKIKFYVNGVLVNTYNGQKSITLSAFGQGNTDYGYWNGIIHNIKVNGTDLNLSHSVISGDTVWFDTPNMMCEKSENIINVYRKYKDNLYIKFPLEHRTKAFTQGEYPSYYNNWGLRQLGLCYYNGTSMILLETLFRDGEAETAVRPITGESGSTDMVYVSGSTHGFENISEVSINGVTTRQISLMVDNIHIGESDVFALKEVKLVNLKYWSKMVQAYTNSNPFVDAIKEWIFDNEITIKTSLKFTRDILVSNIMQGMFCVYRHNEGNVNNPYLTNKAVKENIPYVIFTTEDGWESNADNVNLRTVDGGCNKITEYGDEEIGFAMEITDSNKESDCGLFVGTNSTSYNKIYFGTHKTEETVLQGKEYHATQKWIIL